MHVCIVPPLKMLSEVWSILEYICTNQISASSSFFHGEIMIASCKGIWRVKEAEREGDLYLVPGCINQRAWPPCYLMTSLCGAYRQVTHLSFLKTCNTASVLVKLLYISRHSVPTWGCAQRTTTCKSSTLREASARYVLRASLIGMHWTVAAVHSGTVNTSSAYTVGVLVTIFMFTGVYSSHRYWLWFWKKRNFCGVKGVYFSNKPSFSLKQTQPI